MTLIVSQGNFDVYIFNLYSIILTANIELQFSTKVYLMMRRGHGAGLSIDQATQVVRVVPQLLSIYHEDSQKPNLLHFYRKLDIPARFLEQARIELDNRTTGCDASDIYAFAYLNSIGINWDKIRLILDAFPVISFCDSEPAWELLDNKNRIGNNLKTDALVFLRKRLQISNSDLFAMMKVRLSGSVACCRAPQI